MFTPADDELHVPTTEDFWWSETYFFQFHIPEPRISVALYPWLRANLGMCAAGVAIWDDTADLPWEMLLWDWQWQLPMPEGKLPNISIANGIEIECLEPLQRYHIRYRSPAETDRRVELDFTFTGIHAVYPISMDALTWVGTGHYDQMGRVTGRLELEGVAYDFDEFSIRDRSWGARPDMGDGIGYSAYSFAVADENDGVHAIWACAGSGDLTFVGGVRVIDGETIRLRNGRRIVERAKGTGKPDVMEVTFEDENGGVYSAHGRCLNGGPFHPRPNLFAWTSLVEWERDGRVFYGGDQDIWSYNLWRDYRRALKVGATAQMAGIPKLDPAVGIAQAHDGDR